MSPMAMTTMAVPPLLIIFLLLSIIQMVMANQEHPLVLQLSRSSSHMPNNSYRDYKYPVIHLLKSSAGRSSARFQAHRAATRGMQVSLPLSAGSDYTLSLSIGPSTTVELYMDTGSDIVWFPCSPFTCILCEGKVKPSYSPPRPPSTSSLLSCSHPACSAAHSFLPSSHLCAMAACPLDCIETGSCPASASCPALYYAYGDGSLVANLRHGPLLLPPKIKFPNFTFGCAHSALGETVGVAGFGRGVLSLPGQLAAHSPALGSQFSYCLVSHSFHPGRILHPSPLILGRSLTHSVEHLSYTPMLPNPKRPYFYLVGLHALLIAGRRIETHPALRSVDSQGNGGMVVDSGTTFTMLPDTTHAQLTAEFHSAMSSAGFQRASEAEADTGLAPCYHYDRRDDGNKRKVPGLELLFAGGARMTLPRRNYFMGFRREGRGVGCLMVMGSGNGGDDGGPAGTLGNFQQQGMEVVYDLEKKRVGFARRQCAALWDSLNHGS